jgi:lysyl-tRNA synthetase class 2
MTDVQENTLPEYMKLEEYGIRSQKLAEIRELGVDPYPHKFHPTHKSADLLKKFGEDPVGNSEDGEAGTTPVVVASGRMILFRAMGKNAFAHIQDSTGKIQVMFNRDHTKVTGYHPDENAAEPLSHMKFIEKKLDLGDIIGIRGHLFRTGKGELTIYAKEITLLTKSLLPLADKHSGLADKEMRYRKRWLDLISHEEVRDLFHMRNQITRTIRRFMDDHEFMEVETPIVQSVYGGAEARPFETHLHAMHQDMFLRISLEIPLKKLIVGGFDRVYEMNKVFRNEGLDKTHNPEFTMMECYASYWDYNDMMRFIERLFERTAIALYGDTKVPYGTEGQFLEMKGPWKTLTMIQAIKEYGKVDVEGMNEAQLRDACLNAHIPQDELKGRSSGLLIQALFEHLVETHLIQPHHIIDHPIETTPLCKLHREAKWRDRGFVERFETFILGREMSNAYTELNDPILQRTLLERQAAKKAAGDIEANPIDEEFLESICQGMPPTGGLGIGIDRMVMVFTNTDSIREILFFPWMKPEKHHEHEEE